VDCLRCRGSARTGRVAAHKSMSSTPAAAASLATTSRLSDEFVDRDQLEGHRDAARLNARDVRDFVDQLQQKPPDYHRCSRSSRVHRLPSTPSGGSERSPGPS